MRGKLFLFIIFLFISPFNHQGLDAPRIDSPQAGQNCSGSVIITGNTDIPGFTYAEFSFAFIDSEAWFLIGRSDTPVRNGPLISWDTTKIVDGSYALKIRVFLHDGTYSETVIHSLSINNNSQQTNATRLPEIKVIAPSPSVSNQIVNPLVTPTPMSENPARLSSSELIEVVFYASGIIMLCIILIFIFRKSKGK